MIAVARSGRGAEPSRASRPTTGLTVPIILTVLLVAGAVAPYRALRDATTLAPADHVHLELPWLYLALAPVCDVMDVVACLALTQQLALVVTLGIVACARRRPGSLLWPATRIGAVAFFAVGVLAYCEATLLWDRPMARLRADDPDEVVVDFHAHTRDSHDGRIGFDGERNRSWHASAGFDVAYVTDHHAWRPHPNPTTAGEGTVLLTGAELRMSNSYVVALDDPERYVAALDKDHRALLPERFDALPPALRPHFVLPLPLRLERVQRVVRGARGTVVALELHDGDPRGIEQSRRDHDDILRLAHRLDLALVSGTNLHGWGRTASAWTLIRIPGWRAMPPDQLAAAIEDVLRTRRAGAARVIERAVVDPGGSFARVFSLPLVGLHLVRALQPAERLSWLAWAWAIWAALRLRSFRKRSIS